MLAALALLACAVPPWVQAQGNAAVPAQKSYRIPPGSLSQALGQYAQAAEISLSYAPALVQDKRSPGLAGAYGVADGFASLLDGSGLVAVPDGAHGYVLRPAEAPLASSTDGIAVLRKVDVVGDPLREGYAAATESLAAGAPTPPQHIPQSVQIVTNEVIRDQQAQSLGDILRNIGGAASNAQVYGFSTDAFELRGYTARVLLNGVTPQNTFRVPVIGIERVTVLKGLDSAVLGDIVNGGVVNVQLKQPQRLPVREATLQAGSYGNLGAGLDVGGAEENSHVQYRLIMWSEKTDRNAGGYGGLRQRYLAPSVAWDDGRTRLVLGVEYTEGRLPQRPYSVWQDGRPATLAGPLGNAGDHTDIRQARPYYQFERKLGEAWSLNSTASLTRQSSTIRGHDVGPADAAGDAYIEPYISKYREQSLAWDNNLKGRVDTGTARHDLTFGISGYVLDSHFSNVFFPGEQGNLYRQAPPVPAASAGGEPFRSSDDSSSVRGYVQDFVSIGKWHVLGGLTYNRLSNGTGRSAAWAPRGGVAYDVTPDISVYGNYGRSVSVLPVVLRDGQPAPPISGRTVEAGVKFAWPERPLDLSIAVFKVSQSQVAQGAVDGIGYDLVDGGDSRGVELNVQGQLAPGWQVIGSYAYTGYRSSPGQINQIPRHTASLWTTYFFQRPVLHGWGVGAGLYARASYAVDGQGLGSLTLPGQARTDLSVFYRNATFSATLGVKNVFDRQLYLGNAQATRMFLEPGRTVMLTTTYAF